MSDKNEKIFDRLLDEAIKDETVAFDENPYSPDAKKPEDIVRLFYSNDMPILPVVSKRGILIGVLKKDDVVSELSDLARNCNTAIDKFITSTAKMLSFEELVSYSNNKEFLVINIFGEVFGRWTRLQLLSASEMQAGNAKASPVPELEKQQDEQVLEWMIYLILEHIPRGLYALNESGKTIFYNSHFEELYIKSVGSDVDTEFVERSIKNSDKNELISDRNSDDTYFYNKDLGIKYEKVPMMSKGKRVGFLIYCASDISDEEKLTIPGVDVRGMPLSEMLESIERQIIVDAIKKTDEIEDACRSLKISRQAMLTKIKKYKISKNFK